ncbi:MAG: DUF4962 domain-containing protein, partial [Armatimonadia bacterium]|nr:DUF4962 domain-containing protein [Armatimonadia bacterium]
MPRRDEAVDRRAGSYSHTGGMCARRPRRTREQSSRRHGQSTSGRPVMKTALMLIATVMTTAAFAAPVVLGPETAIPKDPRQVHPRYVGFRPADGQTVDLNPPRMSWPWYPDVLPDDTPAGDRRFTLQISSDPSFEEPEFVAEGVGVNFYNALPVLEGAQTWYWRVVYDPGTEDQQWSETRSFTIDPNATTWGRSALADPVALLGDHPRMLLGGLSVDELLALRESDERSAELAEHIIGWADRIIEEDWFNDFWADDSADVNYMQRGREMVAVAFAYLLTGDAKYEGFKQNFVTMASWPKGGLASPEKAGANSKWPTHLTEYLGLVYDWFYDEFTAEERAIIRNSLEWRIEHTIWSFAFMRKDGQEMHRGSIAMTCGSHPYENVMVSIPGMIAIADESEIAAEALATSLNYLVGVTTGFGPDEAWNEGPGYGNGKMKWLTDAAWYTHTALPGLGLGRNPAFDAYCDFFARVTPIGAQHCSFGNRGINERDWASSRITNFRRMAMLTGNPVAMQNWLDTRRRLENLTGRTPQPFSPWIDYCLPAYAQEPDPHPEADPVKLFALEGWVTASSAPPSDYDAQQDAVSMVWHCRPRGGYNHSFRSENAFDIHAYGETVACGGGTTSNQEFFANHTMSHNTVLVGGHEQSESKSYSVPTIGRVTRFARGDGYVYWAGDATEAYADDQGLGRFVRHVLFVDDAYFVVYDDLTVRDDAEATTFQWLYHVLEADEMALTQ